MASNRKLMAALLCGVLGLTACGGGAAPAAPPPSSAAGASSATAASSATGSGAPTSAGSLARASQAIRLGFLAPLTGPLSLNGKEGLDGFKLYLSSISSTVDGRKIDLTVADSEGQAEVGLTKAKELVDNDHVQVLMGVTATPVCYSVASYVKQTAHVPLLVTVDCAAQGLTINPKFASPYVNRFSITNDEEADTAADWAYAAGYRKAILMTADYAAGIESADLFASAFVARGGTIVQELHPSLGTTDFGPYLAELDPSADLLAVFEVGTDSLRFGNQYRNYLGQRKLQVLDIPGLLSTLDLNQLGDKATGIVSDTSFDPNSQSPQAKAFLEAWHAEHPDRPPSEEAPRAYPSGQALTAAIKAVNGNVEDQAKFLNAIHAIHFDTAQGPISLDKNHNIVHNRYMVQVVKEGAGVAVKTLSTDEAVSQFWDRTPQQLDSFHYGKMKGQWVGLTKAKLGNVISLPPKPGDGYASGSAAPSSSASSSG